MKLIPKPAADWALFLDVDGTLVAIADHPDAVRPDPRLRTILHDVAAALDGAVALVSGRQVAALDAMLGAGIAAAGLHGLERRRADGRWCQRAAHNPALHQARECIKQLQCDWQDLYLEDKQASLALHYRANPAAAPAIRAVMDTLIERYGDALEVLPGKSVFEIKSVGADKGSAVADFLAEAPFVGRRPVFVGDDVTDEAGFAAVNARDGIAIGVGADAASTAQYRLASVDQVLEWLQGIAAALKAPSGKQA